jgi:hypothetical protein
LMMTMGAENLIGNNSNSNSNSNNNNNNDVDDKERDTSNDIKPKRAWEKEKMSVGSQALIKFFQISYCLIERIQNMETILQQQVLYICA